MGGAKNCPETPRQRMIGMMYLVLTAMLALNVSADILNGFTKLRKSMESSIVSSDARTEDIMKTFEMQCNKDEGSMKKYGDWFEIAKANKEKSDEFYNYIETFKLAIVNMVEGAEYTQMPEVIQNGSDTNKPHEYAFNYRAESGLSNAEDFRSHMEEYRQFMTTASAECLLTKMNDPTFVHEWDMKKSTYEQLFNTDDIQNEEGAYISWERSIFEEMPAGAVFALLTKYQNDIRTAENDYLNFYFNAAGRSDFVVNSAEAFVIPQNGEYIMQGSKYRAKIVSAMLDTNNTPIFYINGQEYTDGYYEVTASGIGEKTYSGYMLLPNETTHYPFKGQYTVGAPSATISNIDMDVIYSGYDNKYNISVPGVSTEQLKVSATNASITKSGGNWVVRPNANAKTVTLIVQAEVDGKIMKMGEQPYRVKPLPRPSAFFVSAGTMHDGSTALSKKVITASDAHIEASYGPDGILNLPFTIVSFELYAGGRIMKANGNKFNAEMLKAVQRMKSNEMLNILTIKYKEPGGAIKTLPNFGLIIK